MPNITTNHAITYTTMHDAYIVGNWTERVIRHAVIGYYLLLNVFSH